MTWIEPVQVWLPSVEHVEDVVTPPLGGMTVDELAALSAASPHSFIHVAAAELDTRHVPSTGEHPATTAVSARGAQRLVEMIDEGVLAPADRPAFFVYEILSGVHRAVGIVAEVSIDAYGDGRVRRHESTRVSTEELLVRFLQDLRIHADPVAMAFHYDAVLADLMETVMLDEPVRQFHTSFVPPGTKHERRCHQRVWVVPTDVSQGIQARLDTIDRLYITDGHHRFAAAARHHRRFGGDVGVLAALYADDSLTVLPFDRVISTSRHGAEIVEHLRKLHLDVRPLRVHDAVEPSRRGVVTMVTDDGDFAIELRQDDATDPVASLDVSRLQRQILAPVFGVDDPTRNPLLRYTAGEGERGADRASGEVAFLMYPTTVAEVMAVADADLVMPPKSTWFEPKAWGGLFIRRFDD